MDWKYNLCICYFNLYNFFEFISLEIRTPDYSNYFKKIYLAVVLHNITLPRLSSTQPESCER